MSSTSSSDCENCDYCQCYALDNNYDNYSYNYYGNPYQSSRDAPFYSTMENPLVYYAQVQRPLNRRQKRDQQSKGNRNCFVKAFKWYTQERVNRNDMSPERSGFANWLDVKYVEYLKKGQVSQTVFELNQKETTTLEPCAACPSPREPCTSRKFARMRNPWRKRTRTCKDSGDVPDKCTTPSCEFIMQPKDLTRAASDLCYPTPTSGCNKSNTTLSSCAPTLRAPSKCRKSFSMTSLSCDRCAQIPVDVPCAPFVEGSKSKQPTKKPTPHREKIQQVPSKSRGVDVACQCPEERVIAVDEETQCESLRCKCFTVEITSPTPSRAPSPKTRTKIPSKYDLNPTPMPSTQNYKPKRKARRRRSNVICQCPKEIGSDEDETDECKCVTKRKSSVTCRNESSCSTNTQVNPKTVQCSTIPTSDCEYKVKDVSKSVQETKPVVLKRPRTITNFMCECIVKDFSAGVTQPMQEVVQKNKSTHNDSCEYFVRNVATDDPQLLIEPKITRQSSCTPNLKVGICACRQKDGTAKKCNQCACVHVTTDDMAQTSDHSICLETEKYPIIMKVIC